MVKDIGKSFFGFIQWNHLEIFMGLIAFTKKLHDQYLSEKLSECYELENVV